MFKERLKLLRLSHNLTQDGLARSLNLSPSTISLYENGAREPDINTIIAMAKFFNTTTDNLLGVENNNINKNINEHSNLSIELDKIDMIIDSFIKIKKTLEKANREKKEDNL